MLCWESPPDPKEGAAWRAAKALRLDDGEGKKPLASDKGSLVCSEPNRDGFFVVVAVVVASLVLSRFKLPKMDDEEEEEGCVALCHSPAKSCSSTVSSPSAAKRVPCAGGGSSFFSTSNLTVRRPDRLPLKVRKKERGI
jgi:hypothetical protein